MQFCLEAQIEASPETVFNRLADLNGYTDWLPKSREYNRTQLEDNEMRAGARYTDFTGSGPMTGVVLEYDPPRCIAFQQELTVLGMRAVARSHYELEPSGAGTHVQRTYTFTIPWILRPSLLFLGRILRRENQRVLAALKKACEDVGA